MERKKIRPTKSAEEKTVIIIDKMKTQQNLYIFLTNIHSVKSSTKIQRN